MAPLMTRRLSENQNSGPVLAKIVVGAPDRRLRTDDDDGAVAHALATAGVGAGPPMPLQHRSQQRCGDGGRQGGCTAWRGLGIRGAANRVLSADAFPAVLCRSAASPVEEDWWLSPLPIARALPPVTPFDSLTGSLRVRAQGLRVRAQGAWRFGGVLIGAFRLKVCHCRHDPDDARTADTPLPV